MLSKSYPYFCLFISNLIFKCLACFPSFSLSLLASFCYSMAAVAAYIPLLALLQLLDTLRLRYKYELNFIDTQQIDYLEEQVHYFLDFLESRPPGLDDPNIKPFIVQICDSIVSACQVLDSHVVYQIRRAGKVKKDKDGKWLSAFREDMIKVRGDLESIRCNVTESATLDTVSELPLISTDPSSSNSTIKSGDPKVIGFEHHTDWLKKELTDAYITKGLKVISIVGMGGIGKTTLARFVYEDLYIRQQFDNGKRYWVTISQEYVSLLILQSILDDKDCDSIRDLGTKLYQSLKGFRYLIVLDDMWELGAWEDLKQYFPEDNRGSRIIVTSRDKDLAAGLGSSKTCDVGFLSEEKSWELFCDRVFGGMCCPSEQLGTIGRQILKNCSGLPLGIITIAGLLSKSNMTCEYWDSVSKDVAALVNFEDNESCRKVLSLSYDYLPLYLKSLFLYIGVFHNEDERILIDELIRSLVAFALVRPKPDKSIQQVTKDYIMELFQRNLIFIRDWDEIGEIKGLGIHDLLRNLCLKENSDGKLFSRVFSKRSWCHKCLSSQRSFYLARHVGVLSLCRRCKKFDKREDTSPSSLFWNIQAQGLRGHESLVPIYDIFRNSPQLTSVNNLYGIKAEAFQKSVNESERPIIFDRLFYLRRIYGCTTEMSNAMPSLRNLSNCELEDSSDVIFPPQLDGLTLIISHDRVVECLSYPQSLRYLSLKCGKIGCDQMNGFVMLPNLEALTVFSVHKCQDVWKPNEDGFRRLKYLCILGDGFCKYWPTGSDTHFPELETLVIDTPYLLEIPQGLEDIGNLRKIELSTGLKSYGCHKDVVSRAKWILKQQQISGNDQLRLFICGKEEYSNDDEDEEDDGDDEGEDGDD